MLFISRVYLGGMDSFTSIRTKPGKRKMGVKKGSKVQRLVDELVDCGSPKQKY